MRFLFAKLAAVTTLLIGTAGCPSSPPPPAQAAGPKRIAFTVGENAEISARRESLRARLRFGVKRADKSPARPLRHIRSNGTAFVSVKTDKALTIGTTRSTGGALAAVAEGGAESSDTTVATVVADGSDLHVNLTGKLGNSFITTFDSTGQATAKVMVLAAEPLPGTAVIEDESLEPTGLVYGDYGTPGVLVTDFADRTNAQALNEFYAATPNGRSRAGTMTFATADAARKLVLAAIDAAGQGPFGVRAIYFPGKDLMVTTVGGDLSLDGAGGQTVLSVQTVVSQADFEKYVPYGGNLSSSPLHESDEVETGILGFTSAGGLSATRPVKVGVVLGDGRKVMSGEAEYATAEAGAVRHLVAYPQRDEPLGDALTCETSKTAQGIDWSSLYATAETKLVASANWNGGKPSIALDLTPHMRVGGQLGISGHLEAKCEKTMFEVPIAEWSIPLFGKVAVNTPVKVSFSVEADGSIIVMTPRIELGSANDQTKPGKLGFSYAVGGTFKVDHDVAVRTSYTTLGAVAGSAEGDATVQVEAGIAAGLGLEAEVKNWLFKASVRADLGDVVFGLKDKAALTVHLVNGTYDATNDFKLGVFPHLSPKLQVDTSFFKKSFNLFTVDLGDLAVYDKRTSPRGEGLFTKEEAKNVKASDGTPVAYVQASDRIEFRDLGDIVKVDSVVRNYSGGDVQRFVDPAIAAGISGVTLNLTGVDLANLAMLYQQRAQGTLLGDSSFDVLMANGKTVNVFVGNGLPRN